MSQPYNQTSTRFKTTLYYYESSGVLTWLVSFSIKSPLNWRGLQPYIDFQRAFDSISHPKLIHKLSSYGISGNLLCWIMAFLTNRRQMVRSNSTFSSICDVISGVPQGSVLGPLLLIIFINDTTDNLDQSTTAKLFADDIKLYSELSFPHNNLQTQLDKIHTWSSIW